MENTKKYLDMTMDELEREITDTKSKLLALQKLLDVRRLMGEKTTKQIVAKEKAQKKKENFGSRSATNTSDGRKLEPTSQEVKTDKPKFSY